MKERFELHLERQISLESLLRKAGNLTISLAETSTLCSRLARLNHDLTPAERAELEQIDIKQAMRLVFKRNYPCPR